MSRFVLVPRFADPIPFEYVDRPVPTPGAGEVLVRVRAAGLNPIDWKLASIPGIAEHFGVTAPTGFGGDAAGVVEAVGEGVDGLAVGDRVFGNARGAALADHLVAPASSLHRTPDGLDDVRAAGVETVAKTAAAAIATIGVREGDVVLIGGAAGGVGVIATQLAVAAGATVIGTASEGNHAFLRDLGAIPVAYGDGLVDRVRALAPTGVDAATDLAGTETVLAAIELGVAPERISTIAAGPTPPAGARATGSVDAEAGASERIAAAIADGAFVLPIEATFPFEALVDAVALLRAGHVRGKVVVTIGD